MEDKEFETHLKLKKHFDHKFNSKVALTYSNKRENIEHYKSRYKSPNETGIYALRMLNHYNSKLF